MNEQWGQILVLDVATATLRKQAGGMQMDPQMATKMCERLTPLLNHSNTAVVMSCVNLLLKVFMHLATPEEKLSVFNKTAAPLITLLTSESSTQFLALRSVRLIIEQVPHMKTLLESEIKVFFIHYNDPVFVKNEKIELLLTITNSENFEQVLSELVEYSTEADVDFVRKAVGSIGKLAIKLAAAANQCVTKLLEMLTNSKISYIVQASIIAMRDIFRRYPGHYDTVLGHMTSNLDLESGLDDPEAKAAWCWILGEYADKISGADDMLEGYIELFDEESIGVQLTLLTAAVKVFLKVPGQKPSSMVQDLLVKCTETADNPDLRDRAYIYWRMLSSDPEQAKQVVLGPKPVLSSEVGLGEDRDIIDELGWCIPNLSSVFLKPSKAFVSREPVYVDAAMEGEEIHNERLGPAEDGSAELLSLM